MGGALETLLRGLCIGDDGLAKVEQLFFGLAYQTEEDGAVATALPTKAVHDLLEGTLEVVDVGLERERWRGPLRRDLRDQLEDFF
jgi:hypothetical protein